jgi:hypothetical protein
MDCKRRLRLGSDICATMIFMACGAQTAPIDESDTNVEYICADDGCGEVISEEKELLRCDAPGCDLAVSESHSLFIEKKH